MEIVEKHLPHHNPISAYPFYVLVETSGSHESHDREVRVGGSEVWEVCVCEALIILEKCCYTTFLRNLSYYGNRIADLKIFSP